MKVSFIITFSTLDTPTEIYQNDNVANPLIQDMTLRLVEQIKSIPIDKEIIIIDGTGDYQGANDKDIVYKLGPQYFLERGIDHNMEWLNEDYITDWRTGTPGSHAEFCSLNYQYGVEIATGDYLIIQHNDTEYQFQYYSADTVITDAIKKLEEEEYEYITVDKKPIKDNWYKHEDYVEGIEYFADVYWFLCRKDFYKKHNIYVDWSRGDSNHLATIACHNAGLKYLHLRGYLEARHFREFDWIDDMIEQYGTELWNKGNFHILNDKLFLIHVKGGTGLNRIKKHYHGITD